MLKSFSANALFSVIAFVITLFLGFISIGALGAGLYYPVSFLLKSYPSLNDWHGDWVWPAMITVGMLWSLGFIFGAISWHYLAKTGCSKIILVLVYLFVLWAWAALLWWITLHNNRY